MKKLRWILAPFAVGLLALTVACSGDDDSNNQSNDNGSYSGAGSAVSQELNLAQAANQLMELRSFRFNVSFNLDVDLDALANANTDSSSEDDEFGQAFAAAFLAMFSNISMEGAYVAPDSFDMQASFAGEDVHYVQIGNEAWVDDGSGWTETAANGGDLSFFGDPTSFATDMLPDAVLQNAKITDDEVDGMPAKHYHFDKDALEAVASDLGEEAGSMSQVDEMELDVWLIEGNIPVKVEIKASGTDDSGIDMSLQAKFEITDINDDISIDRPIP
jgi:hypothetical protein